MHLSMSRSSRPEVFPGIGVLKICSKFTRVHPCRSAISIKLQSNFIEFTLQHGYSTYFQNTFPKKISGRLLLNVLLCLSPLLPCIRCIHNSVFWENTAIELRKRQRGVVKIIIGSFMKISMMKLKSKLNMR